MTVLTVRLAGHGFKQNSKVSKPASIAKLFRSMASTADKPCELSDDDILLVIAPFNGDDTGDGDLKRVAAIEAKMAFENMEEVDEDAEEEEATEEGMPLSTISAQTGHPFAIKVAALISDTTEKHLDEIRVAGEIKKRGPCVIVQDLRRDIPADIFAAFPVPGTKDMGDKSNTPYDRYRAVVAGRKGGVPASLFMDIARLTKKGRDIRANIKSIDSVKDSPADAKAEHKAMGRYDRQGLRSRLVAQENSHKQSIVNAVKIMQQMDLVAAKLPKVGVDFIYEDEAKTTIMPTPDCIKIYSKADPMVGDLVSWGSFITMDVEAALADGGKWSDLQATAGSGAGGGGSAEGFKITGAEGWQAGINAVNTWFEDKENQATVEARLNKKETSDDLVDAIGDFHANFHTWYVEKVQKRWIARQAAKSTTEEAKAGATTQADVIADAVARALAAEKAKQTKVA